MKSYGTKDVLGTQDVLHECLFDNGIVPVWCWMGERKKKTAVNTTLADEENSLCLWPLQVSPDGEAATVVKSRDRHGAEPLVSLCLERKQCHFRP